MARFDKSNKDFAKKLVQLSLEDGMVSAEKVTAVLATLAENPPRRFKPILKQYLRLAKQEIRKSEAVVEHSGELGEETLRDLKDRLSTRYNRTINVTARENPDLIAGVRVSIADDVYDISLAGQLDNLARTVH